MALIAFVLGMLAKPTAMVTPLILLVLDLGVMRRGVRKALLALLPWVALTVVCALWTAKSQPPSDVVPKIAPALRPLVATDALAVYLCKLFVPLNLTIDPGRRPDWVVARGYVWYTWLAPAAALLLLGWWWRRIKRRDPPKAKLVGFAAVIPLVCLGPVLGLRSFDFQQYSTVAEHYLYPAMVGPALLVALLLSARLARQDKRAVAIGVAGVILALLAVVSHVQTYYWKDSLTLFTHAVEVNPHSYAALNSLAATYVETGRPELAMEPARRAVELRPDYARYYLTLGNALGAINHLDEAKAAYRQAIALAPDEPSAHGNLAGVLARAGDFQAAEAQAKEALRLDPQDAQAHLNLGTMYAQQGRNEDAIHELEASLQLNPDSAIAHANLGFVLLSVGKPPEAAAHFVAALKLNPNYIQARNGLAQAQGMMRTGSGGGR
jgi:Flp pilus assembly protein TadD